MRTKVTMVQLLCLGILNCTRPQLLHRLQSIFEGLLSSTRGLSTSPLSAVLLFFFAFRHVCVVAPTDYYFSSFPALVLPVWMWWLFYFIYKVRWKPISNKIEPSTTEQQVWQDGRQRVCIGTWHPFPGAPRNLVPSSMPQGLREKEKKHARRQWLAQASAMLPVSMIALIASRGFILLDRFLWRTVDEDAKFSMSPRSLSTTSLARL